MQEYLEKKFKNKKILILGFAREGRSTYAVLKKYLPDADITLSDQDEKTVIENTNIKRYFGKDYLDHIQEFDVVIKSPGISAYLPKIREAQKKGIEITSQTKIFFDICKGVVIGITGTKGKSTTASLIYEIIKNSEREVSLVGNIGTPVLDSLTNDGPDKIYVFELSSHQLFDLDKSPQIAVVTNVAVDHLDWYGDFDNYVDAKTHIVKYQTDSGVSVLNYDNIIARGFDRFVNGGKVFFTSKDGQTTGAFVIENTIYLNLDGKIEALGKTHELKLIGKHNWDNVMMAAVVAKYIGIDNRIIWQTATNFKQLEHHLEFVKEINGVCFYDDSFAVDQIATLAAINSFKQDITLIIGGFDRGIDYKEITSEIAKKTNLVSVIVIGQIAEKLIKLLKKENYKGKIVELGKTVMDKIVKTAMKHTSKNGIILFSPAAASFDMFKDYKDRGQKFKDSVNRLSQTSP